MPQIGDTSRNGNLCTLTSVRRVLIKLIRVYLRSSAVEFFALLFVSGRGSFLMRSVLAIHRSRRSWRS